MNPNMQMKNIFTYFIVTIVYLTGFNIFVFQKAASQTGPPFDHFFSDQTLRLDYCHTGIHDQEMYSLDEMYIEPVWAGSKTNLVDTLNLGQYFFKVIDIQTNTLIYSRGFSSIFGEWQTTEEARNGVWRTFDESIRFPLPKRRTAVTIGTRDRENVFHENWSIVIDPEDPKIQKTVFFKETGITRPIQNGNPSKKIDLVILPDGYTLEEMKKFRKDASHLFQILFENSPFDKRKNDFNIWTVEIPSNESGIDDPQNDQYMDNALSCSYNAFGSDRYVLTYDNKTVRKAGSRVPYDFLIILVNSKKYGGGGIYNLYSTCSVDNNLSDYVLIHEFGHSFGGLGDEYYTSDVAYSDFYPAGVEPWEPNITAQIDRQKVKWNHMIDPDTPVPTPWNKEIFDSQQTEYQKQRQRMIADKTAQTRIDSLTAENDRRLYQFMLNQRYWGKVGVYEGSGYTAKNLFRPFIDCYMFSRNSTGFDPVCKSAIEKVIDFYVQ